MTDAFLRFRCSCGAKLKAPIEKVGQTVGCPTCLARVTVPEPAPVKPGAEVDLAEVDDEPEPQPEPKRSRKPEREVDDGIPIRRGDRGRERYRDDDEDDISIRSRSSRRRSLPEKNLGMIAIIMCGLGFAFACFGSCGAGRRSEVEPIVRFPFLLVSALGSMSLLGGTIWSAVAWSYIGTGSRVKLYRVGAILGGILILLFGAIYPIILIYR